MTLILATGDNHFCLGSRWDEALRVHAWIAEQVEELRPDLFLCAGDMWERASVPAEREAVKSWVMRIADVCPLLAIKGNHEKPDDLSSLLTRLRTRHPIIVEERAGVYVLAGVAVAAFAWPSRAMLAAAIGDHASPEVVAEAGREALRNVLRGLGAELAKHDGPRVLLGHAQVVGARVGLHGQPLAVGSEITCGLEDLALAGADAVVLGHIHDGEANQWEFGGVPMGYVGSPFRNTFGETERKTISAIRFEQEEAATALRTWADGGDRWRPIWERIETPCTPMVLLDGQYADGEIRCAWDNGAPDEIIGPAEVCFGPEGAKWESTGPQSQPMFGGDVRLRYSVASEHREAAGAIARRARDFMIEHWGPASVRLDEVVIASTRARTPEVAAARTVAEQLAALWQSRSDAPSDERRAELVRKLAELESEGA